jgi:pimeloyl-ACP methyl ester carboxylesterase
MAANDGPVPVRVLAHAAWRDHPRQIATDVRAVNIENSGHWVAEEQPEAVSDALLDFLPSAR